MPRRRLPVGFTNPQDEKIEVLQAEISKLRHQILAMLQPHLREPLLSYSQVPEVGEVDSVLSLTIQWSVIVIEGLLETVGPANTRIVCPLCGSNGKNEGGGYLVPRGIEQHLRRARECAIMEVARALAMAHFESRFQIATHAKAQAKTRAKEDKDRQAYARRMATEPLLRLSPGGEPELRGRVWPWAARNTKSLKWAEARLASLGFVTRSEGRITSYVREYETVVVYADPRPTEYLEFHCFPRRKRKNDPLSGAFTLEDNRTRGLQAAFQKALEFAAEPWATPDQLTAQGAQSTSVVQLT